MIERLKENRTFYICLSIFLAILFWLYVREVEDPVMDGHVWNVPVELTGESILASQGLAVAEISEENVDFKVTAPASVLESLSRKNVTAILDVSKCVAGENILHYTPKVASSVNTDGVSWVAQSPETITVRIEKLDRLRKRNHSLINRNTIFNAGNPAVNVAIPCVETKLTSRSKDR